MKHFYKYILLFCLIFCCSLLPSVTAEASDITDIKQIDGLSGKAKYMQDAYRDNYSLDIEYVGVLDGMYKAFNHVASSIFSMIKSIAYTAISFFYYSLTFDITAFFSDKINAIQELLKNSVFEPLLFLGFFFSGVTILKRFLQQNMMGIFSEFCKVIVLILISILLVSHSNTLLTATTSITKSISISAFTGVNSLGSDSQKTMQDYAADAAGILWQNMVHDPWMSLEFGNYNPGDGVVEEFLSSTPDSEERKNLVEQNSGINAFSKGYVGLKIGNCIIYLIVIFLKSGLYIAISGIAFVFQIFSIFYLLIAPLILILALFPSYQGIVNVWFRKFMEVQVSIFIITLILGLIVKLDSMIFNLAKDLGWFMCLIFQLVTIYFIYKERDKIIHAFSNVQRAVESPAYAATLLRNGMNVKNLPQTVRNVKSIPGTVKNDAVHAARTVKNNAIHTAETVGNAAAHTKTAFQVANARLQIGLGGGSWTKAGMEKRAEEASIRQNLRRTSLQHNNPDLYKSMQKREQEEERMKDYGSIRRTVTISNQTLSEMRAYERAKERAERDADINATKAERSAEASDGYSNIVKFEDRPRLYPEAAQDAVNMRTNDDKTITETIVERPTLNQSETTPSVSSQDTPVSASTSSTPIISSNNVSAQNKPITSANAVVQRTTRQTAKQNIPRVAGSFTAIETNAPVNAVNRKIERPKMNTGQYKEPDDTAKKKTK